MPPQVGKAGDVSAPVISQAPVKIEEPKSPEIDKKPAQKQEPPKQDAETAAKNAEAARQHASDTKHQETERAQRLKNQLDQKIPEKKASPVNVETKQAGPSQPNQTAKDQLAEAIAKGADGPKVLVDTAPVQAGPTAPSSGGTVGTTGPKQPAGANHV